MYRGTTPTYILELETTIDLSQIVELWITFKTFNVGVTKYLNDSYIDNENKTITVTLTQEETLQLYNQKNCEVQVRFRLENGKAYATNIANVDVDKILREGVI